MNKYKIYVRKNNQKISAITENEDKAINLFKILKYCCNDSFDEIKETMNNEGFENISIEKSTKDNHVLGLIVI